MFRIGDSFRTDYVEFDEEYQLDATTVICNHKISLHVSGIYMPIFRSTGCMLLHVVFSTRCSGCNPEGLVCSPVHRTARQPLGFTAATSSAEHHMQ